MLAFALLSFASRLISDSLTKNRYSAESIIKEDYRQIDASAVAASGGGVQVIDRDYRIVLSEGLDTFGKEKLTVEEFTAFLTNSKSTEYHYDILYEPQGSSGLSSPSLPRFGDLKLIHNRRRPKRPVRAGGALLFALVSYLLILAVFSLIYSRVTAASITVPLKKLTEGTRLLREGDYSARVDLRLKNEFAQLPGHL